VYKRKNTPYWWAKIAGGARFSTKEKKKSLALTKAVKKEDELFHKKLGIPMRTKGKPFEQAFLVYLEDVKTNKSWSHWNNQRKFLEGKFLPYFGPNKNIKEIEELDIKRYLNKRKGNGASDIMRNREFASLQVFFKFAKSYNWISYNPTLEIHQVRENMPKRAHYTKEEAESIFSVEHPGTIMFWLSFFASLRPGEVLRIKWDDIDFKNKIITVGTPNKSNRPRQIPLHSLLEERLKDHPQHLHSPYVLCQPDGKPYKTYQRFVEKILKLSGVPKIKYRSAHGMRHSFGTYLIEELGVPVTKVQRWMGHADPNTTMRYNHPLEEADKGLLEQLKLDKSVRKNVRV